MEVIATKAGFYGGARRRAGDRFEVKPGDKATWFAPVGAVPQAPKKASKPAPVALSQVGKDAPRTMTEVLAGDPPADDTASDSLV